MSNETKKADKAKFNCVNCGHEKGAHQRKNKEMGRCWERPNDDWKKPACTCQAFEQPR